MAHSAPCATTEEGFDAVANLIIEMPDDLLRSLKGIALTPHTTVQELAVERRRSLVEGSIEPRQGSQAAVLRAMDEPPHLVASDVGELEAAIATHR